MKSWRFRDYLLWREFLKRFWRTIGYPRDKKKLVPQNPASSSSSSSSSSSWSSLATLSNGDGDGSENAAEKRNLHSCKLNRVYLDPLNMSNAGDVSWNWIVKGFYSSSKKGRKIRRRLSTSSIKRQIRRFHVVVVQWTSNVLKRVMHVQSCCFVIKPIVFWSCHRRRRRSCLSSLLSSSSSLFLSDLLPLVDFLSG